MSKPTDARLILSSFGGGWVVPLTDEATPVLESFFGGPASLQGPIDEYGWLVEPHELEFLAEHVNDAGIVIRRAN